MDTNVIEEIVKWRMGSAYDTPILDWRDSRLNFDTSQMLDSDYAGGVLAGPKEFRVQPPTDRKEYDPTRHKRLMDSAQDIYNAAKNQVGNIAVFMAMQDARIFPSVEFLGPPINGKCVQLSYARPAQHYWRTGTEVILWPLTEAFRWWSIPTFNPVPWQLRKAELIWRGQPTGSSYVLSEEARPALTGIRRGRRWLNGWLKFEAANNEDVFHSLASTYQRLVAVKTCLGLRGTDVRFVPMWDGDRGSVSAVEKYLGQKAVSERISSDDYSIYRQQFKYVLAVPGNDIPSSLRLDLLSESLVLMPSQFWESVWFFGLKPNVHYIPLRADLADLEERLQWCRDNDGTCLEIAKAGRAFALEYFDPALEKAVQSRLVSRLAQQTLSPRKL